MPERTLLHLKRNLVAYLALFIALGGSSYAAVRLTPGSVDARALAKGAVTKQKLARNSVTSKKIADGTLGKSDFKPSLLSGGPAGLKGGKGAPGPRGPAGRDGGAHIAQRARSTATVTAPHGGSTNVPLANTAWTQADGELDLIAGTMTVKTPATCTGSFGNSLVVSVDGTPATFAVAPSAPASATVTLPFNVGTVAERGGAAQHQLSAALTNSCTKDGENFTVTDVKLDVLKFD